MFSKRFSRLAVVAFVICSLAILPATIDPAGAGSPAVGADFDING